MVDFFLNQLSQKAARVSGCLLVPITSRPHDSTGRYSPVSWLLFPGGGSAPPHSGFYHLIRRNLAQVNAEMQQWVLRYLLELTKTGSVTMW